VPSACNAGALKKEGQHSPVFEARQLGLEARLTRFGAAQPGRGLLQILSEGFHAGTALSCQAVLQRAGGTRELFFIDLCNNSLHTGIEPILLQLLYLQCEDRLPPCVLLLYYTLTENALFTHRMT